jgi:asparagine synthase (glutamine-hydrolysing)
VTGIAGIFLRDTGEWAGRGAGGVLRAEGISFVAAGRVDNRDELPASAGETDAAALFDAYRRWGDAAPARIYGDWEFAAWHADERRLTVARDHFGNASLYYVAEPGVCAFSTSLAELLAMNLAPIELDELWLAQLLLAWPEYHGERTLRRAVRRLPPAHVLTVTPESSSVRCYWRLEDTPALELDDRREYVEGIREVFDEAVRVRLRGAEQPGATLSGGLDSTSVAATAARLLGATVGPRLRAYTAAPVADTAPYVRDQVGDEAPFAEAVARVAGHTDLRLLDSAGASPVGAVRRMLDIRDEPLHGASAAFWLLALFDAARVDGCDALLIGQAGNGGISWEGDPSSQAIRSRVESTGLWGTMKVGLRRRAPASLLRARKRRRADPEWYRQSAIHPELAVRLDLDELRFTRPRSLAARTVREQRCRVVMPGRSFVGSVWDDLGAAFGLDVRDPTGDPRVLAYSFSVPDRIFRDPETRLDRWLIRAAMEGRLPDEVRLNPRRGLQSADIVPRLRRHAADVEEALAEVAAGPAADYVDVAHLRDGWERVQAVDAPESFAVAVQVLMRGLMAGLWLNGFDASRPAAPTPAGDVLRLHAPRWMP